MKLGARRAVRNGPDLPDVRQVRARARRSRRDAWPRELGLNLYRIDLSQVVSKYIGETEKALAQVFDEVEAGHGLLLFDEADALFGRRSEVKDAHDRYANIEVGYLLQRLESYEGIAVLTTNLQGNMDAAFVRRLRFILHFPAPDRDLRRELWERSLPGTEWRAEDLELDALADRFQLNGGAIHNIGLAAAHLAAATSSGRVTTAHVVRATQRELQKTGRPADSVAFGPLGALLNGDAGERVRPVRLRIDHVAVELGEEQRGCRGR